MLQLTLPDCGAVGTLSAEVEHSARRWAREFGDGSHLSIATRATRSRFSQWGVRVLSQRERVRVRAYFDAVVRRALIRGSDAGARAARRRLVEASIAADLRAVGWDEERAAAEARLATAGPTCGTAA